MQVKVMRTNILHKDRATLKGYKNWQNVSEKLFSLFDAVIAVLSDH